MKKTAILFILSIICWITATAQFTITGTITDATTGAKLSSAAVGLKNTDFAVLSGISGNYQLKNIVAGKYQLIVSFVGYNTFIQDIELNKNLTIDVALVPGILLKEAAVINATRVPLNAPSTLTYVSKDEISDKNTGLDLPYLLNGIPSAVITSDAGTGIGYTGIRIRGTDMTRINVTVNGIPYNDPESHEVYWVDMPDIASSIDNIEIQRGVGTSTNGAASFGGSINIQTDKTRDKAYGEVDLSGGSFNSLRTAVNCGTGLLHDHFTMDVRLSRITSDGYIDRASANLKSFFVSGTYLNNKSMLKLNIFSGKERTYQAWDGIPSEILDTNRTFNVNGLYTDSLGNIQYYKNEVDDYQQDNYQLLYNQQLPMKLNFSAALHYTHGEGYYEQYEQDADPSAYGLSSTGIIASTDLISRKWLKNDFYGIVWSLSKINKDVSAFVGGGINQYQGDYYGRIIWTKQLFQQQTFDYQWYFNTGKKQDANLYVKILWAVSGKLGILGDLQYRSIRYKMEGKEDAGIDITQNHDYQFVNPKTGLIYTFNEQHKMHLYAGIANREPNRSNFQDADSSNKPKPEQLYNFELGYEFSSKKVNASVNLYFMGYNNQLVLTGKINNVGAPIMVNVPSSYRQGVEFLLETHLVKWLNWGCNLTLSQNKIKNFTEYVDDWVNGGQIANVLNTTDLSFSPNIMANSSLSFKPAKGYSITLLSRYVGKQYIDNTSSNDRKLNPYFVNDLRFSYSVKSLSINELEISLLISNLLNEKYETNAWVYRYYIDGNFSKMDGYFPQATRNIMLGLKIKF